MQVVVFSPTLDKFPETTGWISIIRVSIDNSTCTLRCVKLRVSWVTGIIYCKSIFTADAERRSKYVQLALWRTAWSRDQISK